MMRRSSLCAAVALALASLLGLVAVHPAAAVPFVSLWPQPSAQLFRQPGASFLCVIMASERNISSINANDLEQYSTVKCGTMAVGAIDLR